MEIKDFEGLLSPALREDQEIISYKASNLVGPGDNYGSLILAVDVDVKSGNEEDELHLVAKMCPTSEFIKILFNIPVTFKKEVGFYKIIVPTLQDFQRERGCEEVIDFVPKYVASRFSLDPSCQEVDDDACLLLENIKTKGFEIGNRLTGFDVDTAEFLIKNLAVFHAVPIALKILDPKRFEEKVQPYLVKHVSEDTLSEETVLALIRSILDCAKTKDEYHEYLDRMEERMCINAKNYKNLDLEGREPFATIVHSDFWVNNAMLKYEDGILVKNAIIDFQMINYGSPANDLVFFIYSSLSNDSIAENYHGFLDLYYDSFIEELNNLGVDTSPFGYEAFLTEVDSAAKELEFFHIMYMLKPIFAERDKVEDCGTTDEERLLAGDDDSKLCFEKMFFVIRDFAEKGWI